MVDVHFFEDGRTVVGDDNVAHRIDEHSCPCLLGRGLNEQHQRLLLLQRCCLIVRFVLVFAVSHPSGMKMGA